MLLIWLGAGKNRALQGRKFKKMSSLAMWQGQDTTGGQTLLKLRRD